ncbi:MAG: TonB-dependent receptor [Deltaproteobacteria bacterium]|nr:MAG: TonB-dependent receptor [Deltaproteobacteria bacterium]
MMKKIRFLAAIFVLFLFLPLSVPLAQDEFEEEALFRFEEYVVTAAKYKQKISESPSTITVITEEDIKHSGATNLGDLLRMVPGYEVMELSPSDHEIGARGENKPVSNGILTMVNGRSIYLDFWGMVLWDYIDVPLESIKRIELIRGPGSPLYGANAFHGVVNIITKGPEDFQHADLSFTGGELDTYIGTAIHSGKYGDLGYLLSAGWDQTSHWEGEGISRKYPRGRASLIYNLGNDSKITFEGGATGGESEVFHNVIGLVDAEGASYNLMLDYQSPKFYLRTFWNGLDVAELYCDADDMVPKGGFPPDLNIDIASNYYFKKYLSANTFDVESQYIFDIGRMNSIVVGADFRYNTIDSDLVVEEYRTQDLYAGYLQHEFRFRDILTSFLGVRYDKHPLVKDVLSPRGSLIISAFQPHIFRLSVGRAFRTPSFMESYVDMFAPVVLISDPEEHIGRIYGKGNEELKSEKLTSYEIGYQTKLLDKIQFNLNLFYNQISKLIALKAEDFELEFPLDIIIKYSNRYNRAALGGEADVNYFITEWLKGFLSYAFTKVKDTDTDKVIKTAPKHKIYGGLRLIMRNGLSSELSVHYVSKAFLPPLLTIEEPIEANLVELGEVDSYTIVNLRVGYKFLNDQIEVAASAFNLLEDKHREYPLTEEIGRKIVGTVSCSF